MLQLDKVRKVFPAAPEPYVALDGVDLEVADGEILCLLGRTDQARYSFAPKTVTSMQLLPDISLRLLLRQIFIECSLAPER